MPNLSRLPRPPSSWRGVLIAAVVAASFLLAIGVGHWGAPRHARFDWRLFAEAATAFGTLLLAGYTAWLATTTRDEVRLTAAEQRARDRPDVIATPGNVTSYTLEQRTSATTRVLAVRLVNAGTGPAIDVRVNAKRGDERMPVETIPVLQPGDVEDCLVSLTGLGEDDVDVGDLEIEGSFMDRAQDQRFDLIVRPRAGILDEQRAAERIATKRAVLAFMPASGTIASDGRQVTYPAQVLNSGSPVDATSVVIEVRRADDRSLVFVSNLGVIPARGPALQREVPITVDLPHPALTCVIRWNDEAGAQENVYEDIYAPLDERRSL